MEDNSITPNQSSVHDPNSLEASAQSQSVADLAGLQKDYPIETLEVRSEGDKSPVAKKVEYVPTVRSVPFSKRKAVLISLGITLVVVVLTGVSLGYLVRENAMDKNSVERNIPTQGVSVGKSEVGASLPQFNSDQPSLLVDGDIITRGELKVSSGNFMTVIRNQNATADQVINIPASSGELCLSANNCSFATIGDLAAVQGSIVAPTTLNSQDGEVTIQGASNRINVTTNGSVITITTPQALNTAANVQFSSLTLSSQLKVNSISVNSGDLMVSAANGSVRFIDGDRTFRFPSGGLADQTICTTQNNCNYGTGNGDIVNGGQIGPIIIGTNDASSLSFYTNAVNRLDLSSNGNLSVATDTFYVDAVNKRVGIGTAAPASIFEVHSTSTTPNFMTFRSSSVGYAGAMMVLESDTAARARGVFFTEGTKGANGAWFVGSGYTSSDFMIGNSPTHTTVNGNGAYNLGNAALIVKAQSKLIGIGTNNPDARLHVSSVSPSNRGLIIQAAASQTANLQEWQSSTGTILASVNATGVGSFANLLQNGNQVCDSTNNCSYAPATGGAGYIQNQTAVSQAAGFNISGNGTIGGNLAVNTNTLFVDAANNRVGIGTATPSETLDVVGNAQVSNFMQIGPSSLPIGTCQTLVTTVPCKIGLRVTTLSTETNRNTIGIRNAVAITAPSSNTGSNYSLSSSLDLAGPSAYGNGRAALLEARASGGATVDSLGGLNVELYADSASTITNATAISTTIGNSLMTGAIQNATGILVNSVSGSGTIQNAIGMQIGGQTAGSNSNIGLLINESSTASLLLTGLSGNPNSGITFGLPGFDAVNLYRSGTGMLRTDNKLVVGSSAQINSGADANIGLVIQGAASQTANLQEWQSSTGTILASVNATGVGSFANLLQNGNQVCDNTNNCSYAPSTGGAGYIQNQTAVSQAAGFNISGNGTIGGNLAVNTNTLFVDAVSGRVGVGTAAPDYALHVVGNSNIVGDLQVGTNALPVGTCQVIAATVPCKQGLRVGTSSVETNQNTTGIHNVVNIAAPSANTATNRGLSSSLNLTGSTTYNSGVAGLFTATANSGAAVSSLAGIGVDVYAANTGSATNGVGININIGNLLAGGTIQNATGININTFTNNGAIETAMGMVINGQTAGSSHNVGLAINESSTASLLLTSLTGSSSSGITFGYPGLEIVNLYRSDIGTLQLDGNFNVRDRLVVGTAPGFSIGSIPESGLVNVKEFTTQTLGTGLTNLVTVNNSVSNGTYVGQSGVTSTDPTSLNNLFILLGSQNFVNHQGGGNIIGSLTGQSIMLSNSGSGNVASTVGLAISGLTNAGGGSVTNNYGIQVQAQSAGLNNYGIAIGNASTQTLWLQGDGGTANTGIGFGSTRDTNIYRSETGVLKTDGKLIIGDNNQPLFFGGYYGGGSIETPSFVVNATTSSLDYTAGSYTQLNLNPSSASAGGVGGVISITSDSASIGDINELVGGIIGAGHFGSGVAHQAIGQQTGLINGGTGVIDDATGLYVAVQNASTGSITSSSGLHISAVDATSDAYGIRINDVTSATNSYGIAVGEASTQTLWLQGDGGTANTGIGFGSARDTNLYRSAAGVLKTDNRLEVVDRGTFGNNITALEGSFTASLVANRTVNTPSVSEASSISQINFNPTTSPGLVGGYAHISTAATVQTSTESVSVTAGSLSRFVHKGSGGVGVAAGLDARVMLQGTGNISQAAGIRASVQDTGAGSVNLGIGLAVGSVQAASDAYGVLISPLSSATNNYGIAVGEASTQTLWLQGDGGTANTGIGFGSARDTNLYRSAAGVLRTDGNLIVGSEMLVVGAVNLGAELTVAGDVTLGGNLEVVNATVNGVLMVNGNLTLNGHVISGNTSGSTTIAAGSGAECSAAAVVTIDGNDTAGTVEVTTGGGACSPGELVSVIFANTYGSAPKITITPANAAAAGLQYYAGSATTSSLTIDTANAPSPSTSYSYNYQVIE